MLLDTRSELYAAYANVFVDFDAERNLDLGYVIDYLADRTERVRRLFDGHETDGYCMQSPESRLPGGGGSSLNTYGQARVRRCRRVNDAVGMQEMFVIKRDGQVR